MNIAIDRLEKNRGKWVDRVKKGVSKAFELLYRAYRKEFIIWIIRKSSCTQEMALDIFQESVLALYKNVKAGHLDEMRSSFKTYLFSIGYKIFYHQKRKRQSSNTLFLEERQEMLQQMIVMPTKNEDLNEMQQLISQSLLKLRLTCQDILTMFYYKGMTMNEIAEEQNYSSVNVAKVMKLRCMKALRKIVLQKTK